MRYIKKKIEKKELIKRSKNSLYLEMYKSKVNFYYNNIILKLYYSNSNQVKQYLKEVGVI